MSTTTPPLVLASSSPFRRQLLHKLGLPFQSHSPEVDESARPEEAPGELVRRLARDKAGALAAQYPRHLIIGSDQVAVTADGQVLGKPGGRTAAIRQLETLNGSRVEFLTGLCLLNSATGDCQLDCEPFDVHFRELTTAQIEHYVDREEPFGCAGSFKSEGLGIVLFRALEGRDPNTLVGLPLIRLTDMLAREGVMLPLPPDHGSTIAG